MKAVAGWVMSVLVVIGAGVGIEGGIGVRSAAPQASDLPSFLLRQLWNLSQSTATGQGDPSASAREAVGPVSRELAERVTSGAIIDGDTPVYVIEMEGHFVCGGCSSFNGKVQTGTVVTSTINAATLFGTDFGITNQWTSLAPLGKPFALPRPPAPEVFWPITTGIVVTSFTGRWSAPGAEMTLGGLGGRSSIAWSGGRRFIDFLLNESRSGSGGVLPSEAGGFISSDNVGLAERSHIVLSAGESGLSVMTTPSAGIALPGPFRPS